MRLVFYLPTARLAQLPNADKRSYASAWARFVSSDFRAEQHQLTPTLTQHRYTALLLEHVRTLKPEISDILFTPDVYGLLIAVRWNRSFARTVLHAATVHEDLFTVATSVRKTPSLRELGDVVRHLQALVRYQAQPNPQFSAGRQFLSTI